MIDSTVHVPTEESTSTLGGHAREAWLRFCDWQNASLGEGVVSRRTKLLVALALSHAAACPYSIDLYTRLCLEAGCSREELAELVHVTASIQAGSVLFHAAQMHRVANEVSM